MPSVSAIARAVRKVRPEQFEAVIAVGLAGVARAFGAHLFPGNISGYNSTDFLRDLNDQLQDQKPIPSVNSSDLFYLTLTYPP